jgi:hypothetical protein
MEMAATPVFRRHRSHRSTLFYFSEEFRLNHGRIPRITVFARNRVRAAWF